MIKPIKVKGRYCDVCDTQLEVDYPASCNVPTCPKCGEVGYW